VACTISGVLGYTTTASFMMIPLLVSAPASTGYGLGAEAAVIGAILVPGTLVGAIGAGFVPRLERLLGAKTVMVIASGATLASGAILLTASGNMGLLAASSTVAGLGIGLGMTQAMNLVVVSVPEERIASVTGLGWVLRSVGGTLGGQLSGSVLAGHIVAGTTYSTWSAFSTAIWIDIAVALLAVVGAIALRRQAKPHPVAPRPDESMQARHA
jgi:MFS family permease